MRFPRALLAVLREALELGKQQATLDRETFVTRRQEMEGRLDVLIAEKRRFSDPDNARLANRLRKQRQHLFTFLDVEEVEATNNRAERAIRPAVVLRKMGGCNRTPRGSRTHAVLASLLVTAKQQGQRPLDYLVEVLTARSKVPLLPLQRSPPRVVA